MRTALVHHWLTGMRGGEKVLEALCELLPDADIFTLVCDRDRISENLRRRRINTSFIQRLPLGLKKFRSYLPLFPRAARRLDLSGYDLVISSDASLIKAIRPADGVPHVCYCHSPPRYIWDLYDLYLREEATLVQRLAMPVVAGALQAADHDAAQRVTHFVANSRNTAERISRHYRRPSTVIYPPVDVDYFSEVERKPGHYYLFVGQLTAYKKADLAIRAMTRMARSLIVVGDGPQRQKLGTLSGSVVQFAGWVPDQKLREYYARCRALIFPNEEDFGIVPVEAQAAGAPVIALGRGGALETVRNGVSGLFFDEQTPESLIGAVRRFEAVEEKFDAEACRTHSRQFDRSVFLSRMSEFLSPMLEGQGSEGPRGQVGVDGRVNGP
jgi:glycosyltransferase involved in cell wall biosynthesis